MEETKEAEETLSLIDLLEEVIKNRKNKIEFKSDYDSWKQSMHLFGAKRATEKDYTEFFGDVYTNHKEEFTEELLKELATLSMDYLHHLQKFEEKFVF